MKIEREDIKRIYESKLRYNIEDVVDEEDMQLLFILKHLPLDKTIRILDAGCGTGKYSRKLHSLGYYNLFAVDLFDPSLLVDNSIFEYSQASINHLPYANDSFDFVFSNSVIYYLEDPSEGIIEFHRCLKTNGILVFSGHTKYSLFTLVRCLKRMFHFRSVDHLKGVRFRNISFYIQALSNNGFKILDKDGFRLSFFIYPVFRKVLKKMFGVKLKKSSYRNTHKMFAHIKSIIAYHFLVVARRVHLDTKKVCCGKGEHGKGTF